MRFRGIPIIAAAAALFGCLTVVPQSSADSPNKKIVFVAGTRSHGYSQHEHNAGCLLLSRELKNHMPGYDVQVHLNGWPDDPEAAFSGADAVVMYCDGGGRHMVIPHLDQFDRLMKKGVGLACIHYAVEVPKGKSGDAFLSWLGGYFETHWSVNPHWKANFSQLADHPITRGVKPFAIQDEWYFHMRFRDGLQGVTPILSAVPPASTMSRRDGPHSGNPHARAAVAKGTPQHVAWATERADGGRGFGFTGGHFHWNWGDNNFRRLVLNAIVWIAHGDVPEGGVASENVTQDDLEANQDFPKPAAKKTSKTTATKTTATSNRDPNNAVAGLDVHEGLEATLFAAEPMLLNPSNIDVDHLGRVWVCEVVNYRGHNGKRPEGDRILTLEDTNGDGRIDKQTVFYQGRDVDSALGICVLGDRVIVSVAPNVFVLSDTDGDGKADTKESLFTNVGQPQHDHSAHAFVFGPDGKMYWNFGNTGKHVFDQHGNIVVDKNGHEVRDNGRPYYGGMVFRCNEDGSQFEVLAHNFRNNYEVAVDSFGTLWQSDNDDDGNRGVRINYVMEFGNYGYRNELTGAGWQSPRTGWNDDIPTRHWHQNDPGVIPNLLQTGGGSPCGICVYEGDLLPTSLRNQVIHADAGPNVVWAIVARKSGAGYVAKTVNILKGERDRWFRPSDVCVAPDGSLIIADWYDPGVGGHQMGDLTRGRLFRVAPAGAKYTVPTYNLATPGGAAEALKNPNHSVRYLAWNALHAMGKNAEPTLIELFGDPNPRFRARALWLLANIKDRGPHYADLAVKDENPDIRIVGIRLARQLDLDLISVVSQLVDDPEAQVRRECAIALRSCDSPNVPELWARLALQHDGRDRWYLEALGIGAHGRWNECLRAWMRLVDNPLGTQKGFDLIWRSRSDDTPELLAKIVSNPDVGIDLMPRFFRAFDYQDATSTEQALIRTVKASFRDRHDSQYAMIESMKRISPSAVRRDPVLKATFLNALDKMDGTSDYVAMVRRFKFNSHFPRLLDVAQTHGDQQVGIEAMRVLLSQGEQPLIKRALYDNDATVASATALALGNSSDARAIEMLLPIIRDKSREIQLRRAATQAVAKTRIGANQLISWIGAGELDAELQDAAAFPLATSRWKEVKTAASRLLPSSIGKDNRPFPPVTDLIRMRGDIERGRGVFAKAGACEKCHVVRGQGKEVGPNLSEIGSKLSREAMYESILYPSAGISHNYGTHMLALADGTVVQGILVSETSESVSIKLDDAIVRSFPKHEIDEMQQTSVSLMPTIQNVLTPQELADLVEYLMSLKKS